MFDHSGAWAASTYIPISLDPGILGRLEFGSSGVRTKPAQEQSNSDETLEKLLPLASCTYHSLRKFLLDAIERNGFPTSLSGPFGHTVRSGLNPRVWSE